ncbi:MAG: aminopeptidase [Spirochaetales bacterium]
MNRTEFYERYARVVVSVGLNVQENQEVVISAPVEAVEFVPTVVAECYRRGASLVQVFYRDQAVTRARLEHAREDTLDLTPDAMIAERVRIGRSGGASLAIRGSDPFGLAGVDAARQGRMNRAMAAASSELRDLGMKDHFPWCLVSMPDTAWAKRVFPDRSEGDALDALYDVVAQVCRLDAPDPVAAWKAHSRRLTSIATWLTDQAFDEFIYHAPGTDLTVGMPQQQRWIGTEGTSANGVRFIANMPTDEVFSAPDWRRVEGRVSSTRPLVLNGTPVGKVTFEVEGGRIVEATSEENQAVLEQELDLDDRARYFGEIAFVSEEAPIAKLNTTFFDGLYDENAGCHLAFGNAYATCLQGGEEMSREDRRAAGLNTSSQHQDVTVGSDQLNIIGRSKNGEEVSVLERGRWSDAVLSAVDNS